MGLVELETYTIFRFYSERVYETVRHRVVIARNDITTVVLPLLDERKTYQHLEFLATVRRQLDSRPVQAQVSVDHIDGNNRRY